MYKVNILVVDDNLKDAQLIANALRGMHEKIQIQVLNDGLSAMRYLHREGPYADADHPDVILMELDLPRKDGREVLAEIKRDEHLKQIPVLIFTHSDRAQDILYSYENYANSYIVKPSNSEEFLKALQHLEAFWLRLVKLPSVESIR